MSPRLGRESPDGTVGQEPTRCRSKGLPKPVLLPARTMQTRSGPVGRSTDENDRNTWHPGNPLLRQPEHSSKDNWVQNAHGMRGIQSILAMTSPDAEFFPSKIRH